MLRNRWLFNSRGRNTDTIEVLQQQLHTAVDCSSYTLNHKKMWHFIFDYNFG